MRFLADTVVARRRASRLLAAFAALALLPSLQAHAQTFPARPLLIVHGTPAGSGLDVLARSIAEPMSIEFGQPVVVQARPGADGIVAARAVAGAAPDGHVLMIATRTQMVLNAILKTGLGYDPMRDFAPIGMLAQQRTVIAVPADLPIATLAEFVDYARARPGKLNYGAGSSNFAFITEDLLRQVGADLVHVPYNGTPRVAAALAAGDVQLALTDAGTVAAVVRAGKVRILAVVGDQRWPLMPGAPTLAEAGFRPIDAPVWMGFYAPAGTPPEVLARIRASSSRTLADPAVRERLLGVGMEVAEGGPEALSSLQVRDLERSTARAKELGLAGQ